MMNENEIAHKLRMAGCVFAEEEAAILMEWAGDSDALADGVARRAAGYPLEHVVGWAAFGGLRIAVEPGVFVPRRRTEFLLRQAAALVRPGDIVVDLCCGSGALSAALLAAKGPLDLHAADLDPAAVRCARRNILPGQGAVYEGDLFDPLPPRLRGHVQVLVANAPYVPTDAIARMPAEARIHEARLSLDGGADGLDIQRRIVAEAHAWLAPGGCLLIEMSEKQAPLAAKLFASQGLQPEWVSSEEEDANVMIGKRAGASD
ncbi:putative protein N(5)-glutamine methyltransferase [Paenibacillus whitsoniae]|uniref:peptide chain release factor N(5)-glutamine methyltransferase n=1 Tax=Paenibacillus whitsoniae TaxID=2496558 RepID=A0A430JI46_9BACL|nr:putative protein N(5)-glutamine methyltransferase [Paenibacillus whitsoniae]RTE10705.1 putative protein N(5)-glutamine methyltransferase [Paenibacillus whitsoniae]